VGGTGGTGSGQFQAPSGVVTDSSGNVYVADALNFRIQKFDSSGNFMLMWGKGVNQTTGGDICTAASGDTCGVGGSAPGNSQFLSLDYLGVDSSNNVYVPDCSRNDVQVFRPTGVFVKKWGSPGSGEGEFDCPVDVAPHNAVLQVSDLNNKRVEKFTETDTTAPNTTINSAPSSTTNDTTPNFAFSSSEPAGALFECRVDSSSPNAYEPCTSPHSTAALAEGSHTFAARAIDAAGNPDASPATRRFTVDTTPPDTSITAGPSGPTADRTPTFSFTATEAGSTFKCKVDSQAFAPCRSPKTTAPLADGVHRFYVRATDRAGNSDTSPAHRGIKVDTHRPSSMASAPTSTHRSPFLVAYTASDPSPTTGLFQVELWVHRPGTTGYVKVAVDTTPTTTRSFSYTPSAGAGNYAFFTRAKDKVGNYETPPSSPDAHTQFSP
jgi:hypothetical protein